MGAGLLALILPPLMHVRLLPNLPLWVKIKDYAIIVFGIIGETAACVRVRVCECACVCVCVRVCECACACMCVLF